MSKGQRVGYVRVSSEDQNTVRQLDQVELDRVFTDKLSGKNTDRPSLIEMIAYVREGDRVIVQSMDRLARSLDDLRKLVYDLVKHGVDVEFLDERLVFSGNAEVNPFAELLLNLLGAVAEFNRRLIRQTQAAGIAKAKTRGAFKGRKPKLTLAERELLRSEHGKGRQSNLSALARKLGIGRTTLYEYLREAPKSS